MHDLYKLKDMLVKELEEFGKSGNLSKASLDNIDKLAHATKNVAKVIECCEQDTYSNAMGRTAREDRSYSDRSYDNGYSRSGNERMPLDDRTKETLRRFIETI